MADYWRTLNISCDLSVGPVNAPFTIWQAESLRLDVRVGNAGAPLKLDASGSVVWQVWSGTATDTLYIEDTGTIVDANIGHTRNAVTKAETNLAVGAYNYTVKLLDSAGDQVAVLAYGELTVAASPAAAGVDPVLPTGTNLNDLADVNAGSPTNGQVLTWDTATSKWIPSTSGAGDFLADGTVPMTGDLAMGGNAITGVGNVDGRDVSADGTKLDGIEAGADVTDATNVNAAGAVMETDYNAHTILAATANDTPLPLTLTNETIVGKQVGDGIVAIGRVSAGEITAGTETALRAFSPKDVADIAGTHGGGGGSGSIAPSTFTGNQLVWDWSNANGGIGWYMKQLTTPINVSGVAFQSADATLADATVDVTIPGPVATALATSDCLRLSYWSSSNSALNCKVDLTVYGLNQAMTTETAVHSATGLVGTTANTPEVLEVDRASLSGSSTLYDYYTFRLKFYSKDDHYVAVILGGLWGE